MAGRITLNVATARYSMGRDIQPGAPLVIRGVPVVWSERARRITDHATGEVTEGTWIEATWQGQPIEQVWLATDDQDAIDDQLDEFATE